MTWYRVNTGKNGYVVAYEDHVLTTTPGTNDIDSSVIPDGLLTPGKNFLVGIYARNTSSSGAIDVDVLGSFASDGTYGIIKADLLTNETIGGEFKVANYAINTNGSAPYMKIRIDPDSAGKATQTYRIYVMQDTEGDGT